MIEKFNNTENLQLLTTGQGIFETLRYEDNRLWFVERNEQRLKKNLEYFNAEFGRFDLRQLIYDKMDRKKISSARIKVTILFPFNREPKLIKPQDIIVDIQPLKKKETESDSLKLKTALWPFEKKNPLTKLKTINFGYNFYYQNEAKRSGYDDVIFTQDNNLMETSIANIFAVKDGKIFTPPAVNGILPGIIRGLMLDHFDATEAEITLNEIKQYDYFFITNSVREMQAVQSIDSANIREGIDHFNELLKRWRDFKNRYKNGEIK